MRSCLFKFSALLLSIMLVAFGATVEAATSPFDSLSVKEHWRVLEILNDAGVVDGESRYSRLSILPPDKSKAWGDAKRGPRLAEVVVKKGAAVYEGVVNVTSGELVSWKEETGVQPPWLMEEYIGRVVAKVKADPRFQNALKKRGFDRPEFVQCRTSPPGSFGEERFEGVRIGVVRCFPAGPETNKYPRRVEGLLIFADMNSGEILEIDDYEVIPAVSTTADYDAASIGGGRKFATRLDVNQQDGPAFSLEGGVVTWDRWRFHIQSDQRVGIVISEASWNEGKKRRPILYQGYLSEISVPYMAPYGDWYLRNPIDAGEYSAGGLSDPLVPGVHCPEHAVFINGLIVSDRGMPQVKEDVICLFERVSGDPAWVHDVDGRQNRTLVARMSARLGNYDYLADWEFSPDGQIRIVLGATGIVAIKNTIERFASSKPVNVEERADSYGRFVDDHVVAINHSHYFSFRLDMDVDGVTNDFRKGDLVLKDMPEGHPRKSVWVFDDNVLQTENQARLGGAGGHQSYFRVANATKKNRVGYPTSYHLMPGGNAGVLMSPDDYPRLRAGFVDYPLWITAYHPDERFAAGDYPTLSKPGEGLPAWSSSEAIASADIVAWYTVGMHHVVRAEDWPVMPVLWHDVTLRPFDFFDRNQAVTLEPTKK